MSKILCNLCGAESYQIVFKPRRGKGASASSGGERPERILKCNTCGLIFAEQSLSREFYERKYIDKVDALSAREEKGRRRAYSKMLDKIERIKPKGSILQIGAENGIFLDEARRNGWEVHGVELSENAVRYAREKLDLTNVHQGNIKDRAYPDRTFDVIVMLDVIEYLTDPKDTIIEARRVLKDDGVIYVSAPLINSALSRVLMTRWWGASRYHLFYFTKNTFSKMLDAGGFKVKMFTSFERIFSLRYWVERMKIYSGFLYKTMDFISRINNLGSKRVMISLGDQVAAVGVKARKLDYLMSSLDTRKKRAVKKDMKVFVVLPAFNAEKTLKRTVDDIPKEVVDKIILTDDKSSDRTVELAKSLGLEVIEHDTNRGYGANQKTCYKKALEQGADIVVMVHPDYQYDPTVIPKIIEPIKNGEADAVFGSRMMKGGAIEGGMPLWKRNVNILLTAFENIVLGTYLSEFHSGFRAYSADLLRTVNFDLNSDKFVFDTEIIVQALIHHFKIAEIPIQARYFDEASKIKLLAGMRYGLEIIMTMAKYLVHIKGIYTFKQYE